MVGRTPRVLLQRALLGLALVASCTAQAVAQQGLALAYAPGTDRAALEPHIRVRDLCFSETQDARLRDFIAAMVAQRP